MKSSNRTLETALPGHLDHTKMMQLLGYNLAQACIPSFRLFDDHIGKVFELRQVEFSILMLLSSNADVTQKRLSLALNVAGPNLTIILARLEERGLIERSRDGRDKRLQNVVLTADGEQLVGELDGVAATMEQALLAHLTPAEQAMLFELLKKVAVQRRVAG